MVTHNSRYKGRDSSNSKRTGRKHKHAHRKPSSPFTLPRRRGNDDNAFLSLPVEIHHSILSHLLFRVASSYRRICQSYFELIARRELSLAGPHISDSTAKLKADTEEIKTIGRPPTDAESFFGCLGLWIPRRGTFEGQSDSRRSLQSWFNLVLGGDDNTALERSRWTQLAMEVVSLWRDFLKTSRTPSDTRKWRYVHDSEWSADISADLLEHIWERMYDTETYPYPPLRSTCPEWDVNCHESLIYPKQGKQQWRLTDPVWHQNGLADGEDLVKRSAGDSQALIEPLGLSALPSPIFCYYVGCKWAWSLISRHRVGTGRR